VEHARKCQGVPRILDVGCGSGEDLANIRRALDGRPVDLEGIECKADVVASHQGVITHALDLERDCIPADDATFDIVIANQVLEHTKDIFWIVSEVARVLKVGGAFIVGVPNLASLHNRILLLLGAQPTAIDIVGPHVRGFTVSGLKSLVELGGFFATRRLRGGNFYPFPPVLSRPISRILPRMSVSLFLDAQRTPRAGRFIDALDAYRFETQYFRGPANQQRVRIS
jgi:SAM-dependent methyltransferase